jgi:hypothetical protein
MYAMHWTDQAFTDKAPEVVRAQDQAFIDLRCQHFPLELVQHGGYTNYLDEDSQMANKAVTNRRFGSNFPRLAGVKHKYDPDNLFGKVNTSFPYT